MTWIPIAGCAVCAANGTEGGWLILAATVVGLGLAVGAGMFWWESRGGAPTLPLDPD